MEEFLLFSKYRVVQLLSNGSGGEVFLAEHKALNEPRVIKRLYKNRPFFLERKKEAQILRQLHHAAIPTIYDIEEDEQSVYIIEEFMDGETLKERILRMRCLPQSTILHYAIQLCELIEYLHEHGFLYLDIKPENIIVNGDRLCLIDFGAAISREGRPDVVFGTDGYSAPEQRKGEATAESDVYGIGCVLGAMFGDGMHYTKELRQLYQSTIESLRSKRPHSVADLRMALESLYTGNRRQQRREERNTPYYIGVIGVHEGVDTMALCCQLAGHFREREKGRVACIEVSLAGKHRELFQSIYGSKKQVPEVFSHNGVSFFDGSVKMAECGAKGYSVVISDFSYPYDGRQEEFYRCDCHIALGDSYLWRQQAWLTLQERFEEPFLVNQLNAFVQGGEGAEVPIRTRRIVELRQVRDVYHPDRSMAKLFRAIM